MIASLVEGLVISHVSQKRHDHTGATLGYNLFQSIRIDLEFQGGFIPLPGQPVKAARQGATKGKLGRQDWQSQAVVDEGKTGGNRAGGQRGDF